MNIRRVWAMPNKNTFTIKPIKELIENIVTAVTLGQKLIINKKPVIIDPFVNNSPFKSICSSTNDLDPDIDATFNMDALEYLKND